MASRTLSVALRATVQGYTAPMAQAAAATGSLEASLLGVQRAGAGVAQVGDTLTKRISLPIALVGAAATKMALDFDKSFVTMQTLAGVTAGEVDGLKESVLDLSGETGRAPQELADALYFLQSSGLDSAQAMDALKVSAKASAAGLGETQVIADAISSAMLGYAKSGLTAAEATDVLVATARAGKAEPAELAAQMGRLVPIASELGISFDQVGGAIAALSTKGFNAEQATTALTNVMSKLLKPSQQAAEQLEAVGLSSDGIRQMIAERGLLGTLEELRARLGDSGFVKFLEDQQAVQGGLALLGGDLNATKEIMAEVADSAGATENAFGTWAESMGAKNARAFAEFQAALIRLGDAIAPIAADVAEFAGSVAEAFSNLPEPLQNSIVYFGLFLAALFPILSIGGRVVELTSTLATGLVNLAVPAGSVSGAFNGAAVSTSRFATALGALAKAGVVIGVIVALRETLGTMADDIDRTDLSKLENELLDLAETGKASGETLTRVFDAIGAGSDPTQQFATDLDQLDDALAQLAGRDPEAAAAAFKRISDELRDMGANKSQIEDVFDAYNGALAESDTANRTTGQAIEEATGEIEEQAGATGDATTALQAYADALKAQFDPLFGMVDALQGQRQAQADLVAAQEAARVAVAEYGEGSDQAREAQEALTDAQITAAKSVIDLQAAANTLKDEMASGGLTADAAAQKFIDLAVAQGFTADEASAMALMFGFATTKADELGRSDPTVTVTGQDNASGVIRVVQERVDALTGKTIYINAVASYPVPGYQTFGGRQAGGGVAPRYMQSGGVNWDWGMGPRGTDKIPAWLTPGEMVLNAGQQANLFRALQAGSMTAMGVGAYGGGRGTTRIYQMNFYGPTNDQQVIESIKRFERSNGSGWRN